MVEKKKSKRSRDSEIEVGGSDLNRQNQSEGTPRPFSNQAGREQTRNISPSREHLAQAWKEDSEQESEAFDDSEE